MDQHFDKSIEAALNEEPRSKPVSSFMDDNDEKPRQDPVSLAMDEYLNLVNHSNHSSQSSSNHGNAIFKDVTVWGSDSESEFLETVTNIFLAPVTLLQKIFSSKKPLEKTILHRINSIIQKGEMLLVLGRPGSGCTTLLKTLSGFTETFHGWNGEITYAGIPIATMKQGHRGDLVYNAEGTLVLSLTMRSPADLYVAADVHFPTLPVLKTLAFAAQTNVPTDGMKASDRSQKVDTVTETLLKVFGLEGTKATMVGNEFIQGVSGGERKRVSLAEIASSALDMFYQLSQMLIVPSAIDQRQGSYWDNSTQGLDATTSVRFGRALKTYVRSGRKMAAAALYQASDDLVDMFDKVTLMHDGRQFFFGTIDEAKQYLDSLGFVWSDRQSLSEFFISATDPAERVTKDGWENRVPRTVEDWDRCWKESAFYEKLQKEIDSQLSAVTSPATPNEMHRKQSSYALSGPAQL
jgi:ABC-type multidrug transport system ATPase subunit